VEPSSFFDGLAVEEPVNDWLWVAVYEPPDVRWMSFHAVLDVVLLPQEPGILKKGCKQQVDSSVLVFFFVLFSTQTRAPFFWNIFIGY
jgi:hypothetical protein